MIFYYAFFTWYIIASFILAFITTCIDIKIASENSPVTILGVIIGGILAFIFNLVITTLPFIRWLFFYGMIRRGYYM